MYLSAHAVAEQVGQVAKRPLFSLLLSLCRSLSLSVSLSLSLALSLSLSITHMHINIYIHVNLYMKKIIMITLELTGRINSYLSYISIIKQR